MRQVTQSPTPLDAAYSCITVCPLISSSETKPCQFSSVTSLRTRCKNQHAK